MVAGAAADLALRGRRLRARGAHRGCLLSATPGARVLAGVRNVQRAEWAASLAFGAHASRKRGRGGAIGRTHPPSAPVRCAVAAQANCRAMSPTTLMCITHEMYLTVQAHEEQRLWTEEIKVQISRSEIKLKERRGEVVTKRTSQLVKEADVAPTKNKPKAERRRSRTASGARGRAGGQAAWRWRGRNGAGARRSATASERVGRHAAHSTPRTARRAQHTPRAVAARARRRQVAHMPDVQHVKATVRQHHALARRAQSRHGLSEPGTLAVIEVLEVIRLSRRSRFTHGARPVRARANP